MAISHVSIPTGPSNYEHVKTWYLKILKPLGYSVFVEKDKEMCGLAPQGGGPDFWIHSGKDEIPKFEGKLEGRKGKAHIAFVATSKSQVDYWYVHAVKAGAMPHGKPGNRTHYTSDYYAAYIIDPMGNNIELVYWAPLWVKLILLFPLLLSAAVGAGVVIGYRRWYS